MHFYSIEKRFETIFGLLTLASLENKPNCFFVLLLLNDSRPAFLQHRKTLPIFLQITRRFGASFFRTDSREARPWRNRPPSWRNQPPAWRRWRNRVTNESGTKPFWCFRLQLQLRPRPWPRSNQEHLQVLHLRQLRQLKCSLKLQQLQQSPICAAMVPRGKQTMQSNLG